MYIFILSMAAVLIIANIIIFKGKAGFLFKKKLIRYAFLAISIVIILETAVFNFRSFEVPLKGLTHYNVPKSIINLTGFRAEKDYAVSDGSGVYSIEIPNLDVGISNIYFDIEADFEINSTLYFKDEGHSNKYVPSAHDTIFANTPRGCYIYLSNYGNTKGLKFDFKITDNNNSFVLNGIEFNKNVPFEIIPLRMLIVLLILIFFYFFRPGSKLYNIKFNFKSNKQKITVLGVLAFQILLIIVIPIGCLSNETYGQYHDLTESFLAGRLSADEIPNDRLKELSNPYDTSQRINNGDIPVAWDYAYYNHKYYVYFGPVPVLTVYLPFKAITGTHISSLFVQALFSVLAATALWGILKTIFERWFKNAPLPTFLLIYLTICQGSLLLLHLRIGLFYDVAISSGLAFSAFGIWALLSAFRNEKINIPKLIVSSLMLSLAVGCRPTFVIIAAASLFIFAAEIKSHGRLIKKDNIKPLVLFLIPFAVIGCALMIYNYVRFDSVFEFGSRYQLTVYDNGKYDLFQLQKLPQGLFNYFFNFPIFDKFFPFFHLVFPHMGYNGYLYNASALGFFTNPISWSMIVYLFIDKRSKIKDHRLNSMLIIFTTCALIMSIISIMFAGMIDRYAKDYFWLLLIVSAITFLKIYELAKTPNAKKFANLFLLIVFIAGFTVNLALPLNWGGNSWNSGDFAALSHAVAFWS